MLDIIIIVGPMKSKKNNLKIIILVIVVAALAGSQAYLDIFPPITVVSSESMQHSSNWQYNVLNTGDTALIKKVNNVSDVTTYVQGRNTGFKTFGEYGNVIIYKSSVGTLIIHRAIFYLTWHNGVPVVEGYNNQSWIKIYGDQIVIYGMGYAHRNLLVNVAGYKGVSGFITTGDYNLGTLNISYSTQYNAYGAADQDGIFGFSDPPVNISKVVAKPVVDIPWVGLIKLTLEWQLGAQKQSNPVPHGSYEYLAVTIVVFLALVFFPYGKLRKKSSGK